MGAETNPTKKYINSLFNREEAYDGLRYGRNIPEETLSNLAELYNQVRKTQQSLELMLFERNSISTRLKDPAIRSTMEGREARTKSSELGIMLSSQKTFSKKLRAEYQSEVLALPNPPSTRTPHGLDSDDNPIVRTSGTFKNYRFEPKSHFELLSNLGLILDGTKITGQSRFPILIGEAAALEDALRCFLLDFHRQNNLLEIAPSHMVNGKALLSTGQLPKFSDGLYHAYPGGQKSDLYLIPTAEVPLTNLFSDSVIDGEDLPIKLFGYSRCFRVEVGAGGSDSQGLKRVHDFGKVEMVSITKPENSWEMLEEMVGSAENILNKLDIDYRVIILCTGDLPAGNAFTYDIETRMPDTGWREISSCSNCLDYQARRGNIHFRDPNSKSRRLAHTLNGSAFPTGRLVAATVEQYQQSDGSISVPESLRKYMNCDVIKPLKKHFFKNK